ncbi:serine hydrolase domain-containing protein [Hymenobacter sp. BT770]|uniref:serine hydrolase domain-containing protein n=1 Tax=Hymenobacter sp. BT770 TaxID=2886942 RepID=UPI001D103DA3|nr:serine hydrolase domain-containing protein [Hymenobacter sp. BT770]MCC3152701.1 beta-lactamase family protein [Hymenobacter sp. BT770]MDO3414774.1 serine hydrolase domain-containing protein [Hymenobacter sp. BT770]
MKKSSSLMLLLLLSGYVATAQVAAPVRKAARPKTVLAPAVAPPTIDPAEARRIDELLTQYTADLGSRGVYGPLSKPTVNGSIRRYDKHVPGALALVLRDGKVVYRKSFGVDNMFTQTPLPTNGIFRIASQTKALVSAGLMMLYDEGKFKLDDPISKYLPAFANPKVLATFNAVDSSYTTVPAKSEVTIRQLLSHTSGISYPVIGTKEATAIYAKAHIPSGIGTPAGSLAKSMDALGPLPLMHQPGERFTYGLSVDVLGRLIEVLSGQPLDQYLRRRLFEPLGMRDTYFYLPADKRARLVMLYTENTAKQTVPMAPHDGMFPDYPKASAGTYFSGGAGLSSTIDDYAQFLQMMLNNGTYNGRQLLKPATVALMTQNQIGEVNQGDHKFGLGFSITMPQNAQAPGLSAGSYEWGGIFGTTYWVDPQEKLVALIYTQKYPSSTSRDLAGKFKTAVYQSFVPNQKVPAASPGATGTGTK